MTSHVDTTAPELLSWVRRANAPDSPLPSQNLPYGRFRRAQGESISIETAEAHITGLTLLNDWCARDIQSWEAQPLAPFLGKSFATSLSPWIVTLEALAPFRRPFTRPPGDPQALPYLDSHANREAGDVDITLEVWLQTSKMRAASFRGNRIMRTRFVDAAYWTVAQMVTHHTVNGCNLLSGDLLGTGTLSGPTAQSAACLLELTQGGTLTLELSNGERRSFLEDGDTVTMRGFCERPGFRSIGFGECTATVLSAKA